MLTSRGVENMGVVVEDFTHDGSTRSRLEEHKAIFNIKY